jgi:hypothetical protein
VTALICTTGPALGDIGVTTAARMIDQSDTIFVARLAVEGGRTVAVADRTLKGEAADGPGALIDPTDGRFLAFNQSSRAAETNGAPTLVLGDRDAKGAVGLKWLFASIWPLGYRPTTFRSDSVGQAEAFVVRLLGFSRLAGAPGDLATALQADISGRGDAPPHAALAYLGVAVARDLPDPLPMLFRALGTVAASENRNLDAAAMEEIAILAPDLPPSLAAPLLLDLARRASGEPATILRNELSAMLSARGGDVGPASGPAAMEHALNALLPALRRADATKVLAAYDSAPGLGDLILTAILGRPPRQSLDGLSAAGRRDVWAQEIAALR